MKFLFSILFCFLLLSFSGNTYQVNKLPNGKYHVKFGKEFQPYKDYDITIHDSLFTVYHSSGDSSKGKIHWFDASSFKLITFHPQIDSLNDLDKILRKSFGEPFIELHDLKSIGNTYYFRTTYTGNLHITINSGQLIRIFSTQ